MTLLSAAILQRRIGVWIALVLVAGLILFWISSVRRTHKVGAELEVAPNRKRYFDDDVLEGPRLTKYLWWAFATLAITAVALPVYWLREPFRQRGGGLDRGVKYFDAESVLRGKEAFQATPGDPPTPRRPHYGCENCHGVKGIGGVTTYTFTDPGHPDAPAKTVQWQVPALNTALLRYRPDELKTIITYGRANSPMPPWGVNGGGALNDQQVDDLVNYIQSLQLDPSKVRAEALEKYGTDGKALFEGYCARCHTIGWSYGEPGKPGGGAYGPPIDGGSTLIQFPSAALQTEWVAKTAEYGKSYGVRGVSHGIMPHFEDMLAPEQIDAIVAYERGL